MDTTIVNSYKTKQPPAVYILAFGELCERFSYYGILTILVLYLTTIFHFSDDKSYSIYGVYATFAFGVPIIGGVLADRYIGIRKAIIIGTLFLIAGNLLLAGSSFITFSIGLAFCVIGVGLYKPNATSLVGLSYLPNDSRRESGFTLFYMGMNIGGTLGPVIYGLCMHKLGWHYGFYISSVLMTLGLVLFSKYIKIEGKQTNDKLTINKKFFSLTKNLIIYLSLFLACALIVATLFNPSLISLLLIGFIIAVAVFLTFILYQYQIEERKKIIGLIVLASFAVFFFAASLQVVSSISLFINREVDRTLFDWTVPTTFFSSLYPLAVIVMAPVMASIWNWLATYDRNPSAPIKLFFALILSGLGFICFGLSAISIQHHQANFYSLIWIVVGNLCLGTGELCLMPTIFSAISRYAPSNLQGTMVGVLFLFIASAGYLSSLIAQITNHDQLIATKLLHDGANFSIYSHSFFEVSAFNICIAVLIILLTPWIKSMLQENSYFNK